ncbi:MAG: UPF0182 family protein [Acidimicrobiales bacterium]|nr:UPF0182 family protein [Acidimicrobiales bacterium]
MRPPSEMPSRPPRERRLRVPRGRARTILIVVLVAVFVLGTSLRGIAGWYTDYLWFDSVGAGDVWRRLLGAQVSLVAIFTLGFFALMWVNLAVAERLSGQTIRFGGTNEDELVLRYREVVGRRSRLVRGAVAGLIAVVAGSGVAGQWGNWLLFRHRQDFGVRDETFGLDAGFYVFQLPFLRFVAGWLFSSLVVVLVASVVVHYLNGGIRLQAAQDRVGAHVKAHISVLLAAIALVRAAQYFLDRYQLVFSGRGPVDGATYTDVNVQLKAIYLLVMISLFATVLFIVNIWRRGWVLPVIAVGLWGLVAVLAGELVPAFVQRFRVEPRESALESPYIEHNIAATRYALGLDGIEERDFAADGELTGEQLLANADTVRNIRLWDPEEVEASFQRLQAPAPFYEVSDVDVDRYEVDGQLRQVMVALRQLDDAGIPNRGWESTRLVYTSGYGAIMAPANAKTSDGQPSLVLRDIPQDGEESYPTVENASLYFGEGQTGYKIVNTNRNELEYQQDDDAEYDQYGGADGVPLDGTLRRAAFALRFGEIEPLISSSISPESRILLQRDVVSRVESLAPFLRFDHDPYAVLLDGRIVYVVDGYTTSDWFPNAQGVEVDADIPSASGLSGHDFNYVRNPVKAVVDAYDGTVDFYVVDDEEPILAAYRDAFPDLFTPIDDAPPGLQDHFRYPEDLFRVQTSMWGKYHVDDADQLLQGTAAWAVAPDPDTSESATTTTQSTAVNAAEEPPVARFQAGIEPTYQLLKLPGEDDVSFVLLRPFTPVSRGQLTAFLTATPDGELVNYTMPSDRLPNGPSVAAAGIQQNDTVARLRAQLGQNENEITFGNVLLVPIEQSILYVRSMYITTDSTRVPRITRVVASFQDGPDSNRVAVGRTLDEALTELFGQSPGTLEEPVAPGSDPDDVDDPGADPDDPGEEPDDPDAFDGTDDELLTRIQEEFDLADAALAENDLGSYQLHVNEAQRLVDELAARREGRDDSTTTTEGDPSDDGDPPDDATTTAPATTAPTTTRPSG